VFSVDQLIPGRLGHAEAWQWAQLTLETEVRVGGELVLRERLSLSGAELQELAAFFGSGPTCCFANALLIPPALEPAPPDWWQPLHALQEAGVRLGASALRRGGWSLRLAASGPLQLRDTVQEVRRLLAAQFPRLGANLRKL
jgi:urease accessory protein UreH